MKKDHCAECIFWVKWVGTIHTAECIQRLGVCDNKENEVVFSAEKYLCKECKKR